MEGKAAGQQTIGQSLGWVGYTFYRTESTATAIPENLLDWRPPDPRGGFQFSLAEIVMHITDARRMFAGQLTGLDETQNYWSPDYWRPEAEGDEIYIFRPHGGKQALLDRLQQARTLYTPYLDQPLADLLHSPSSAQAAFERILTEYTAAGQDMTALAQAGPPSIYHVLFMACVHESGHRGTLHTLLRMNGAIEPE